MSVVPPRRFGYKGLGEPLCFLVRVFSRSQFGGPAQHLACQLPITVHRTPSIQQFNIFCGDGGYPRNLVHFLGPPNGLATRPFFPDLNWIGWIQKVSLLHVRSVYPGSFSDALPPAFGPLATKAALTALGGDVSWDIACQLGSGPALPTPPSRAHGRASYTRSWGSAPRISAAEISLLPLTASDARGKSF